MTEAEAHEALLQRWETGWLAIHGPLTADPVPHTYENESFDSVAAWVHVAIEPTVRERSTQGQSGGKYDARGIVRVRVFTDVNAGTTRITELCEEAIGVLEEFRDDDLVAHEGSHRTGPADGRWVMRVVTVPFVVESQR